MNKMLIRYGQLKKKIMKMKWIFIGIIGILVMISCQQNNTVSIKVKSHYSGSDSILAKGLIPDSVFCKIPSDGKIYNFNISEQCIVFFKNKNKNNNDIVGTHPGILVPGKELFLTIDSTGSIRIDNIADSLLNSLWERKNPFLAKHQEFIFSTEEPLDVYNLFTDNINKWDSLINNKRNLISSTEKDILKFQNYARSYSFLFFYGRMIKNLEPTDPFFNFTENIDNNNILNKTMPVNLLYKYEIEYLTKNNKIESIKDFLDYIEVNTDNSSLKELLKAIYLKNIIEMPSYWEKHTPLLYASTMKKILEREVNNPYKQIFSELSESFFASQAGEVAYDFEGNEMTGEAVSLSDFKGKYVFIDVWATWCGPCIDQRPHFIDLASKYQDNDNIQFIMISVDSCVDSWQNYVKDNEIPDNTIDLHIKNGMRTEFGKKYLITFVPKYILIDKEGKIIDANLPNPQELESVVTELLAKKK